MAEPARGAIDKTLSLLAELLQDHGTAGLPGASAKLGLPLVSRVNGVELGHPNAGVDLDFDFPTLIAHAARTRRLVAGTVVGSGTVSNRDPAVGSSCLQERRMIEKIDTGQMKTPFLAFGDRVEIEMTDPQGRSIFGRIDQRVVRYVPKDGCA